MNAQELYADRQKAESRRLNDESKALQKKMDDYLISKHLDPVPDPDHNADGVLTLPDLGSITSVREPHLQQAVRAWVIKKITTTLHLIMSQDSKAGKSVRSRIRKGWKITIVHENSERESNRKFWFAIVNP